MEAANAQSKLPSNRLWCAWIFSIGWISWCDGQSFLKKYYKSSVPIVNSYYTIYKKGKNKKAAYQFLIFDNCIRKFSKKYYKDSNHKRTHYKKGIIL